MSISILYLTNGEKSVYVVRNAGVTPIEISFFDDIEHIPASIRHYAPTGAPRIVGPDIAHLLCADSVLYPNFPKCGHPDYPNKRCIAESCAIANSNYRNCPYFDKDYET